LKVLSNLDSWATSVVVHQTLGDSQSRLGTKKEAEQGFFFFVLFRILVEHPKIQYAI
jgi:hypothetical protein